MGLILNNKVNKFIKGFPTVSDKYNVSGAILMGDAPVQFGDMVKLGSQTGYFTAVTSSNTLAEASDIGGIVLGTNVKLAEDYPGKTVQVNVGEAFNLLINGFVAIQLDSGAKIEEVKPNASVYFTANGGFTTATATNKVGAIPSTVFTGEYENVGTTEAPVYLAEIYVK